MTTSLSLAIDRVASLNEYEKKLLGDRLKTLDLPADFFLSTPGSIHQSAFFIESGAIRLYKNDEKEGHELTKNLFIDSDWCLDVNSLIKQSPTDCFLQTVEPSLVYELDIFDIHQLIAVSQRFFQLGKALHLCQRPDIFDSTSSPEEKYDYLLQFKPMLLQKFPLKQIASYLKMTPETISRVRRKKMISKENIS